VSKLITVPSPAKINLFLHVVGRRVDGYHLLQTAFQFIDLHDTLTFKLRDDGEVRLNTPVPGVTHAENIIVRAAQLLKSIAAVTYGVDIEVVKRIPLGGGLGGGSSNAATTLLVLNKLWDLRFTTSELCYLSNQLGADVPIFVFGHAAFAEGTGEKLTKATYPTPWYVLVTPQVTVPTREIFADAHLTRDTPPITPEYFLQHGGRNDLEPVVRRRYPLVAEIIDKLNDYGVARMTGAGASVYASFENQQDAINVTKKLPNHWKIHVVKGYNTSLLQRELISVAALI